MSKKLILAYMAVVAFAAMALPAVASASPELCETVEPTSCTKVTGEPAIRAHNDGTPAKFVSGGTTLVECSTATLTGKLTKNTGTTISGDISTATFTGTEEGTKCKSSSLGPTVVHTNLGNGVPYCLHTQGEDKVTVTGNNCGGEPRSITFVLTTKSFGTCKYSRTESFTGTYKTHSTGDATGTLVPANTAFLKEEGSVLCPGSGGLEMKFTLETDSTPSTEPLYIK